MNHNILNRAIHAIDLYRCFMSDMKATAKATLIRLLEESGKATTARNHQLNSLILTI
jgi:hypothetical protein